jgi:hypothetical protein
MWIAVAVVIALVLAIVVVARYDPGALALPGSHTASSPPPPNPSKPNVRVTSILYLPSTCWANETTSGFYVPNGTQVSKTVELFNHGTKTCVVDLANMETNGFEIVDQNTPLSVPPGTAGNLSLTYQVPDFYVNQGIVVGLSVSTF